MNEKGLASRKFGQEHELFDETEYLKAYPDVAAAVAAGTLRSGWDHYDHYGRQEGRKANQFDENFYLRSYPIVAEEIRGGWANNAVEHYLFFGKYRGYLPYATAMRPSNAAEPVSRFGGFWVDLPNAIDIIQGKLNTRQISQSQADQLNFWIKNGYLILPNAIPHALVGQGLKELEKAFSGGFEDLRFQCGSVSGDHQALIPWQPELNLFSSKALDIHYFSPAIRNLVFADRITQFLSLLFDNRPLLSQTLAFLRGSGQEEHQDLAYVSYTIPRQFAASWIALEDVTVGAGELIYYAGSHKLGDFLYLGQYKGVHEAMRMTGAFPHREAKMHTRLMRQRAKAKGLERITFCAKKGDVLIWHADLLHGGNPVSNTITRKSIVSHYCPEHISPLYFEDRTATLYRHNDYAFTTGYYLQFPPMS